MTRFPLVPTAPEPERAILVGVEWRDNAWPLDRSLDELERLAHTAGAQCVARLSQRLVKPYPKSFIGSGKVEELCGLVHRMDADLVIFDDDLTPLAAILFGESRGRAGKDYRSYSTDPGYLWPACSDA